MLTFPADRIRSRFWKVLLKSVAVFWLVWFLLDVLKYCRGDRLIMWQGVNVTASPWNRIDSTEDRLVLKEGDQDDSRLVLLAGTEERKSKFLNNAAKCGTQEQLYCRKWVFGFGSDSVATCLVLTRSVFCEFASQATHANFGCLREEVCANFFGRIGLGPVPMTPDSLYTRSRALEAEGDTHSRPR